MAEGPTPGFEQFLNTELAAGRQIDVLEVGGGRRSYLRHPLARYTVLEISAESLKRSKYAHNRLIGDACTFDYGDLSFDVIVFWNVLEHVAEPQKALLNAVKALRTDGMMVIRGPKLRSLKAIVTRMTPHSFHVAYYRRVLKIRKAGRPGRAPFLVEHASGADPEALDQFLTQAGLQRAYAEDYVGDQVELLQRYSRAAHALYCGAGWLLRTLTRSRWGDSMTEFVRVYRKAGVRELQTIAPALAASG